MAIFKCKMCGGNLTVTEGINIIECDFCGTMQTVPNADDEKKTNLFNRANKLRIACEFDRAAGVYESIIAEFPEEAEAYWGLCLCKYGIEYVDDPKTALKIPTCHRTSFESIFDNSNYKTVLSNSDTLAKSIYEKEAKAIDELQKRILNIVKTEKPFDVFICYKETDENGDRTVDSVLAQDIYEHLTDKGFKVFFSRITLEDKIGQEYEPYIFAALNSAKVMLAIGTSEEYYNAVWVKNEWSRFLSIMQEDRSKVLVPCYKDIDPYDMPAEFKNLQGQDMGKLGFMQDLTRGITKIIRGSVENLTVTTSTSTGALTKRGYFFLEDGDFKSADEYFDKALDENPEDSKAYAGKVLAALHMKDVSEINDNFVKLYENKNFERAIRFASGADKAQLEDIKEKADRKWFVKCLTVGLKKVAGIKEGQEIFNEIKKLATAGTIDAYEKIVSICIDARIRRVNGDFTLSLVDSYKRQLDILRFLSSDYEEYSIEDIKNSKYFSHSYLNLSVLEEDVKRMIADGSVEEGLTSNTYCIVGHTEKRALLEKEKEYNRAKALMGTATTAADFKCASEIFKSIDTYKDAAELAKVCSEKTCVYSDIEGLLEQLKEINRAEGDSKVSELKRKAQEIETKYNDLKTLKEEFPKIEQEMSEIIDKINALQLEEKRLEREKDSLGFFAMKQKQEKTNEILKVQEEIKSFAEQIQEIEKRKKGYVSMESIASVLVEIASERTNIVAEIERHSNTGNKEEIIKELNQSEPGRAILDAYKKTKDIVLQAKVGGCITMGKYPQTKDGVAKPIEWLVLEKQNNKVLLLSKYGLEAKPYHEEYEDITWENCTLRKWLNGEFMNKAFGSIEQMMISEVTVKADKNPECDTNPGRDTRDKVFLLSMVEAKKFLKDNTARRCEPTEYAVEQTTAKYADTGSCWWWLRSLGYDQHFAAFVDGDGVVIDAGDFVYSDNYAVRPVLWIDLDS